MLRRSFATLLSIPFSVAVHFPYQLDRFRCTVRHFHLSAVIAAKPLPPNLNQNRIRQIRKQLIDKMTNTDAEIVAALEPLRLAVKEQGKPDSIEMN